MRVRDSRHVVLQGSGQKLLHNPEIVERYFTSLSSTSNRLCSGR